MVQRNRKKRVYGLDNSIQEIMPLPIIAARAPTAADAGYEPGQIWIDTAGAATYTFINATAGAGDWDITSVENASTTVIGITRLATVAETVAGISEAIASTPAGVAAVAIAGSPNWSETVSGIGQLATNAEAVTGTAVNVAIVPSSLVAKLAAPGAIGGTTPAAGAFTTLSTTGLASLGASATIVTGAVTLNLGADAAAGAINVGTGAAARVITVGNITGATQIVLNSGTAGMTLTSTGAGDIGIVGGDKVNIDAAGTIEINSSAGVIGIGNDAVAQAINVGTGAAARTITIGNTSGASALALVSGTGAIDVGVAGVAHTITIGNVTGATALVMNVGTGNFTLEGNVASTYNISATGINTGTITIGAGTGAQTLNLMTGGTGVKTCNIATGAIGNIVTIGSVTAAASLDLLVGTGNFTLEGNVASTYTISGTGANTGLISIGAGTGAQTLNLMTGGTGVKTVNIGTGAIGNIITIGSVTAAASLDLLVGTGNFTLEGNVASTYGISATGANTGQIDIGTGTGAQTMNLATGGTGIKTVNIATGAIDNVVTIGTVTGAASLGLLAGTGNFTLEGNVATTYAISNTGVNTGQVDIAGGTGARTINIGGGGTGIKTISIGTAATADVISIGDTTGAGSTTISAGTGTIVHVGPNTYTPDAITATSATVAASIATVVTEITTNGDSDLDDVSLANGVDGQIKIFAIVAVGNAADSIKITPASMIGGTQITFAANPLGLGCQMYYDAGAAGWIVTGNNGGTIA